MDKKLVKYLKSLKKHGIIFFSNCSENVWNLGKDDYVIFIKIWIKKKSSQFFIIVKNCSSSLSTIAWMKGNLLKFGSTSMYYWSTFLNQVRFLNLYDPIFKQISQSSFFMILTIFWLFIHCEEEKEFCSKIFQA